MGKRVVIGVTGGLATGKTTVADMFVEKGAFKIDADKIDHELLETSSGIRREVTKLFGKEVLTGGKVDRRKLADKVFSDKKKLDELCNILHPAIIRRIEEEVKNHEDQVVVVDAPLLIEAGLQDMVDIVIVVFTDHETQVERAANRGISEKAAKGIITMQMPLIEKVKIADFTIDNSNGDMKMVKEGVDKIWQKVQTQTTRKS